MRIDVDYTDAKKAIQDIGWKAKYSELILNESNAAKGSDTEEKRKSKDMMSSKSFMFALSQLRK
ncbi:hypothetical protein [Heyndrickxia coagulans]|uniref:hypothetical protein n=1 Tax=Heyndrickxia coagulans TaxID=1398 RepID=UPI002E2466F5|nr:hypothetical protein [Heyndrickxia coagulans]